MKALIPVFLCFILAATGFYSCTGKKQNSDINWDAFNEEAETHADRADSYAADGDYDRAIEEYNLALKAAPDGSYQIGGIHLRLGLVYDDMEDSGLAIEEYTKALDSGVSSAYLNRGLIYYYSGDYTAAIADLTEYVNAQEDDFDDGCWYFRGMAYQELEDYDSAISDYSEYIRCRPDDTEGFLMRALAYAEIKKYRLAVADCSEAINLGGGDDEYFHTLRGEFYSKLGEHAPAIEDYSWVLANFSDADERTADLHYRRGYAHAQLGHNDLAIKDYSDSLAIEPYAHVYEARGQIYLERGDFARAASDFTLYIQSAENDPWAYYFRAQAYEGTGDWEKAISDCNKCIALDPENGYAHQIRGECYLQLGDEDNAAADFEAAENLNDL